MNLFSSLQFDPTMFSMVVLVDIVLSGDNAIVIGMAVTVWVAGSLTWDGGIEVFGYLNA